MAKRPTTPAPKWLTTAVREVWEELAPVAEEIGTLTALTAPGFARFCEMTARYRALAEFLHQKGAAGSTYPLKHPDGRVEIVEIPQAAEMRDLTRQMLALEERFGFIPSK